MDEIQDAADKASEELIPPKSKKIYEKVYCDFVKWCKKKQTDENFTETVLLAYFFEKSNVNKASTLWAKYSMLRTVIKLEKNIDISNYCKLLAFIKRKNEYYTPKKSKILATEQVDEFLNKASDEKFLMVKVALILGVAGACRSIELLNLSTTDVQDVGSSILFNIKNTKNKVDRTFIVKNSASNRIDFVQIYRKYMTLRSSDTKHSRFFVNYTNNKCTVQPVGKNTFSKLAQNIASFLNLPEATLYTGHCFRRTSASLLADAGADIDVLKRHGGWKSASVAEGYVENSLNNKKHIAEKIFGHDSQINVEANETRCSTSPQCTAVSVDNDNAVQSSTTAGSSTSINKVNFVQNTETPRLFNIVNCKNVNINVHFNLN